MLAMARNPLYCSGLRISDEEWTRQRANIQFGAQRADR